MEKKITGWAILLLGLFLIYAHVVIHKVAIPGRTIYAPPLLVEGTDITRGEGQGREVREDVLPPARVITEPGLVIPPLEPKIIHISRDEPRPRSSPVDNFCEINECRSPYICVGTPQIHVSPVEHHNHAEM